MIITTFDGEQAQASLVAHKSSQIRERSRLGQERRRRDLEMPIKPERLIEFKEDRATHRDDLLERFETIIREPVQLSAADAAFITSILHGKRASMECKEEAITLLRSGSEEFRQ